ncbi:MAG: hypothetical protein HZB47_09240 [Nitrosomonadales bacterium]|nr:hypothetical protein [Nitrosomonadales bacterium]
MATIVMNMDGCDIAHETDLLREFNELVMHAGQEPRLALATMSAVAKNRGHANTPAGRGFNIDLPSAANEVGDSVRFVLPSAFPKCP